MTDTVVVEGQVRLRDGKKWRNRWVVLRKPSPVADCLSLLVYKDKAEKSKRERSHVTLGDICGLEALLGYEGVAYALAILCLTQTVMLGFDSREALLAWDLRLHYSLGEVHRFSVNIQPGTKLECGPASLHLCNNLLVIGRDLPPVVIGQWKLSDLRRYGAVPNGFVFEGGTRCGYWAGVFFLLCSEGEQISFLFDCIVRGISPTKGPFGLRPVLPDPSPSTSAEDRISQEASELEKRLSMLSTSSRQSSTASSSSYCTSLAGDDRSISSSSSDTSQSDNSLGSRIAIWAEPVRHPPPTDPSSLSGATGPRAASVSADDRLYAAVMGGVRPPSKPPRPRALQETGRQGSADSGIATGSHSSYSGSFSSYTGSLDIAQGETDEYGSLASLPLGLTSPPLPTHTHSSTLPNVSIPSPAGNNPPPHSSMTPIPTVTPAPRLCSCPLREHRTVPSEYQVPSLARLLYDTPRNLLLQHNPPEHGGSTTSTQDRGSVWGVLGSDESLTEHSASNRTVLLKLDLGSSESLMPPRGQGAERCSPSQRTLHSLPTVCSICGGVQGAHAAAGSSSGPGAPDKSPICQQAEVGAAAQSGLTEGPGLERTPQAGDRLGYEMMGNYAYQRSLQESDGSSTNPPAYPMRLLRQTSSTGGPFVLPGDAVTMATDRASGDGGVNYINLPVSPTSKRQLHYMELDLQDIQEPSPAVRAGSSSTKYAHIDITATEAVQRVGAEHAQGREERLQELEQRRKGALN